MAFILCNQRVSKKVKRKGFVVMQNFKMYFKFDSDYSDEETENTL